MSALLQPAQQQAVAGRTRSSARANPSILFSLARSLARSPSLLTICRSFVPVAEGIILGLILMSMVCAVWTHGTRKCVPSSEASGRTPLNLFELFVCRRKSRQRCERKGENMCVCQSKRFVLPRLKTLLVFFSAGGQGEREGLRMGDP